MKIEISNQQQKAPLQTKALQALLTFLMTQVQQENPDQAWEDISLVLMDDHLIADVNREHLGHDGPTDVISFTLPPVPGTPCGQAAEIMVNVERALTEGPQHDGPSRELAFYIAHGCLHLTGADDQTPNERAQMHQVQTRWLSFAEQRGIALDHLVILPEEPGC
jgi:probable rRNA maturation factor